MTSWFFPDIQQYPKIHCSFLPYALPTFCIRAVIGWFWVRCRHRSECPFISALGRWTPHLISDKGNFSIFYPVYSDTATNLGFFITSLHLAVFSCNFLILIPAIGLRFLLPWTFQIGTSGKSLHSRKQACGLCSFLDRLSFFVGAKAWERNSPRRLQRAKPRLKSQER